MLHYYNSFINTLRNNLVKYRFAFLFFKVLNFYLFSFGLLFLFFKWLIASQILLYLFIFIILIGLSLDKRIQGIRKLVFIFFLVLHFVFWEFGYWQTEVFIIKEIFWYSLTILGCFIWHVLILNWLYQLTEKMKWEYGKYVVSRISLTSSVMGIIWVIQWGIFILEWKYQKDLKKGKYPNAFCEEGPSYFIFTWGNLLLVFLYILLVIFEYFSFIFQSYAKLIIGKSGMSRFWNIPLKYWILIIGTFYISFALGMPRIYIMWIILLLWNIIAVLKVLNDFRYECQSFRPFNDEVLFITKRQMDIKHRKRFVTIKLNLFNRKHIDRLTYDWHYLYPQGLFEDYICYSQLDYWALDEANYPMVLDIYHPWLDVFTYSEDRLYKILGRVSYNYWIYREFEWDEEIKEMQNLPDALALMKNIIDFYGISIELKQLGPYIQEAELSFLKRRGFFIPAYKYIL